MRRSRTQINVWPAIADLMTVTVVAVLLAGIGCGEDRDLLKRINQLEAHSTRLAQELQQCKNCSRPSRSCFSVDRDGGFTALVTITIKANAIYHVARNPEAPLQELNPLPHPLVESEGQDLNFQELREFGKRISQWGEIDECGKRCKFWVEVRQGSISQEECALRWLQSVGPHFGGATNLGSLCKSDNS